MWLLFIDNTSVSPSWFKVSPFWVVCLQPLVTNQHLLRKWVSCRTYHQQEGICNLYQAIYVPADDYTDPAPATAFTHLRIQQQTWNVSWYSWYLPSRWSTGFQALVPWHLKRLMVSTMRYCWGQTWSFNVTMNCKDIIAILGMDELSDEEKTWCSWPIVSSSSCLKTLTLLNNLLANLVLMYQWRKQFAALRIIEGKHDHLPEDAFRGVSSIEDVIAKAEKWDFKRWSMTHLTVESVTPDGLVWSPCQLCIGTNSGWWMGSCHDMKIWLRF